MGWNGSSTYGVRVDSARLADTATNALSLNGLNSTVFAQLGPFGQIFTGGRTQFTTSSVGPDWFNCGLELREVGQVGGAQSSNSYSPRLAFHWSAVRAHSLSIQHGSGDLWWDTARIWNSNNDGAGSGLDADLLDGLNSATAATASTIAARDGSGKLSATDLLVSSGDGRGLKLWDGSDVYSVYMSHFAAGGWGGRVDGESASDYNMYFRMAGAGRGFVFKNDSGNCATVDGSGNFRNIGYTKSKNGITDIGNTLGATLSARYLIPGGAVHTSQSPSVTGAIRIKLPRKGSSAMLKMRVEVYNYNTATAQTFVISGYAYESSAGVTTWVNLSCEQFTEGGAKLSVRYGYDATNDLIWIGELASTWSYPQVFVTEFMHGYSGHSDEWTKDWSVTFATAFDTVTTSRACAYYWNTTNDGAGSALDADLLDGQQGSFYQSAANLNAGILPDARLSGTYTSVNISGSAATLTTARLIGGVSFNGSANINLPGVNAAGNQPTTGSAATLTTGRTIAMTGDVTWTSPAFTGAGNITAVATVNNVIKNTVGIWLNSSEGQNRFNFASSSHSFYKTGAAHIFYNSADTTIATLDSAGNLTVPGTMYMAAWSVSSDRRLKDNFEIVHEAGSLIDAIDVYSFTKKGVEGRQVGIIAQDLQIIDSNLVTESTTKLEDGTGALSVDATSIMFLMLAELKSLRKRVAELEA